MVNGKGKNISDADLITTAATCGIQKNKVQHTIAEVDTALKKYL